jgi:hypothetical protein
MGLQADLAGNKAMTITRRQVLTWIPPVVAIVHLPVHAQTSPIATGPQTPLPPQCLWTRNEDGQVTAISRPFDDQCVQQACATETTPEPGPLCRGDAE